MLASSGHSVKFWNAENFSNIQELPRISDEVSCLSWNKNGQFLATLNKSSEITLYSVDSTTAVQSGVIKLMDEVNSVEFCETTNRYLAACGSTESVIIWDVKSNARKKIFNVKQRGLACVSFSCTDTHLAAGTLQGDAFILSNANNLVTGPVKMFSEKTQINDLRFSSLSPNVFGGCAESGHVSLVDSRAEKCLREFKEGHTAPSTCIAFSPFNELLMVSVGYDKKLISYNANSKTIVMSIQTPSPLTSVCFVENGLFVALGTLLGQILVYDLRALNDPLHTVQAHPGPVLDLKIQPQCKMAKPRHSRSVTKKAVHCEGVDSAKMQRTSHNLNSHCEAESRNRVTSIHSPSIDLLSPLKVQQDNSEPIAPQTRKYEGSTYLKRDSLSSAKKEDKTVVDSDAADEIGILSPIDIDSKCPLNIRSSGSTNFVQCSDSRKPLIMEGLLSPLQTSPKRSVSLSSKVSPSHSYSNSPKNKSVEGTPPRSKPPPTSLESTATRSCNKSRPRRSLDLSIEEDILFYNKENVAVPNTIHSTEITSPETKGSVRKGLHSLNNDEVPMSKSMERAKKRLPLNEETRTKGVDPPGGALRRLDNQNESTGQTSDALWRETMVVSTQMAPKEIPVDTECTNNAVTGSTQADHRLSSAGVYNLNSEELSNRTPAIDLSEENGKDGAFVKTGVPKGESSSNEAYQIAFPEESQTSKDKPWSGQEKPQPHLKTSGDLQGSSVLNVELVRNCFTDELQRHQFAINQRLLHLNYNIIKHSFSLKKELRETFLKASLADELAAENKLLKEELRRFRPTY